MKKFFLSLIMSVYVIGVSAQDDGPGLALFEKDAVSVENDLAITLSNPLAPLTTVHMELRVEIGEEYNYQLRLEPSYYLKWDEHAEFLIRTLIPLYFKDRDPATGNNGGGLGDITITPYYLHDISESIHAGAGVAFGLPTYQGRFSKWTAGPALFLAQTEKPVTYGSFVQHVWSYADAGADAPSVYVTTIQPFATYMRGGGWAVTGSSEILYNWASWADSKERWIVPVSVGVSRVAKVEESFYKFSVTGTYNTVRPDGYQRWELWFGVTRILR